MKHDCGFSNVTINLTFLSADRLIHNDCKSHDDNLVLWKGWIGVEMLKRRWYNIMIYVMCWIKNVPRGVRCVNEDSKKKVGSMVWGLIHQLTSLTLKTTPLRFIVPSFHCLLPSTHTTTTHNRERTIILTKFERWNYANEEDENQFNKHFTNLISPYSL